MEYLNHLSSTDNKLNSISREMKALFFSKMNEIALNKNDELKYLILMREERYKAYLKFYFFKKWKYRALYNQDLIDMDEPFFPNINNGLNNNNINNINNNINNDFNNSNNINDDNPFNNDFMNNGQKYESMKNNNFEDLLIKEDKDDNKNNKIDLLDVNNVEKGKNNLDNILNNEELFIKENINDKEKELKKFEPKKLYKYQIKDNYEEEEKKKYKDSKYISSKYINYLGTCKEKAKKSESKKKKGNKKNKNNDNLLFGKDHKDLVISLAKDYNILKNIEKKNHTQQKEKKKQNSSLEKYKDIDKITKKYKIGGGGGVKKLLNDGYFTSKNKKNQNKFKAPLNDDDNKNNDDDNIYKNDEGYNSKIKKLLDKYNTIIAKNDIDDQILSFEKPNKRPKNKFTIYKKNKTDKEYDDIINNRTIPKINYDYSKCMNTEYLYEPENAINYNSYYKYDDLVNNIHKDFKSIKTNRPKKDVKIKKDNKEEFFKAHNITEADSNNYVLSPMISVPVTKISFRARMKYFDNKKKKNLEKMIKEKNEEEKQIYTFQPNIDRNNKLNVLRLDNSTIDVSRKNRINELYLDYKDRKNKINQIKEDYFKEKGYLFSPQIEDSNPEIIKYKNQIGQIPFQDRVDIYNYNKQLDEEINNDELSANLEY